MASYACFSVLSSAIYDSRFPYTSKTTVWSVASSVNAGRANTSVCPTARNACTASILETVRDIPRPRREYPSGPCIDFRTTGRLQLGSSGWTRTNNPAVNSRTLCQLSYRGLTGRGLYMDGFAEPKIRPSFPRGQDRASRLCLRPIRVRRCCSSAAVCGGCLNGLLSLTYMAHRV